MILELYGVMNIRTAHLPVHIDSMIKPFTAFENKDSLYKLTIHLPILPKPVHPANLPALNSIIRTILYSWRPTPITIDPTPLPNEMDWFPISINPIQA